MSELNNTHDESNITRWKLLAATSAIVLMAYISSNDIAQAEDARRPTLWIELGGDFLHQDVGEKTLDVQFIAASPFTALQGGNFNKPPSGIWDAKGKITLQPEDSDWIFSAAIRYGRSTRPKDVNQQTHQVRTSRGFGQVFYAFQNASSDNRENHTILDFQAGKDVGLGVFGSAGSSNISLGVRFAQFQSRSTFHVSSQPTHCSGYCPYYRFYASFAAKRSFNGVGPSLSWDASAMLAGDSRDGGVSLDWGVNGSLLFGRQKTSTFHQTTKNSFYRRQETNVYQRSPAPVTRSRSATVTNLGGFAGVSWRAENAKVSLGYRADFFFGAMDGGIDSRKTYDRNFYGPYASVSIGLGD